MPQNENETWMTFSLFLAVSELNFSSDLETHIGVYGDNVEIKEETAADCQTS